MLTTFALALLIWQTTPFPLERLSLDRARTLHGQQILVSLLVQKPPYAFCGTTIVGTDGNPDGAERKAVLKGNRFDVEGRRVTVTGTLRVIDHPRRWAGSEIRVEE